VELGQLCDVCKNQLTAICEANIQEKEQGKIIYCTGYEQENLIFLLASQLTAAKLLKEDLKTQQTENQKVIDETEEKLGQLMIESEMQNFNKNGVTYYLTTKFNCSAAAGMQEELFDVLRENDAGDLIKPTVNANSLKSWVKEMMADNEGELPVFLEGKVNVYERPVCGTRKGGK